MNCEDVEHFEIREVLRCILHTILFHRALGLVRPKDIDLELFEITYVQCGDVELERKIDEKIDQFIDRVEKHLTRKTRFRNGCVLMQICLSFYEVKNKQATWFTNKVERLHWEQWYINLNVAQHPKGHLGKSHSSKVVVDPGDIATEARSARRGALESSLRDVLFQIIRFVNEKKDHVPPIPNLEGVSFPYEITISSYLFLCFLMSWKKQFMLAEFQLIDTPILCVQRMLTASFYVIAIVSSLEVLKPSIRLLSYVLPCFSSSDSAFGMDMFKRMLQTGHPTMLS
ncbi:hypothetical protein DH2020_037364 [Rehmannia glutinosa]|uniref:Autophagy-related protein 101 n=1 Tax=Rehmannia glutinosa TaxID=99300 RepID=A0ABR0V3L8_REHGL